MTQQYPDKAYKRFTIHIMNMTQRQRGGKTDRQTERQTDRKTDRQTDRQTDR